MSRMIHAASLLLSTLGILSSATAQERAVPKEAKGGIKQGEPWSLVPESFQYLRRFASGRADEPPAPLPIQPSALVGQKIFKRSVHLDRRMLMIYFRTA